MAQAVSTPGIQKAAVLMVLLGEEAASHIYRNLSEADLHQLTQRIAELQHINPETAMSVLEEYYQLTITQGYLAEGGPEFAQKLLVKAFGENGARKLLEQVSKTMEMSVVRLDSLQNADPQQLAKFLEGEHPQTTALILAHLNSRQASALLVLSARRGARRNHQASGAIAPVFARRGPESFRLACTSAWNRSASRAGAPMRDSKALPTC